MRGFNGNRLISPFGPSRTLAGFVTDLDGTAFSPGKDMAPSKTVRPTINRELFDILDAQNLQRANAGWGLDLDLVSLALADQGSRDG